MSACWSRYVAVVNMAQFWRQRHAELAGEARSQASLGVARRRTMCSPVRKATHCWMQQPHSLARNTRGKREPVLPRWRVVTAALAAQVKTIDDRQTFAAQHGAENRAIPLVMSRRLRFAPGYGQNARMRHAAPAAVALISLLHGSGSASCRWRKISFAGAVSKRRLPESPPPSAAANRSLSASAGRWTITGPADAE